jgi:hypothetical protein
MKVGDLVLFDEEFYSSLKKDTQIDIRKFGMITVVRELFYCVTTGTVDDLWVTAADIKKINLDKASK